MGKISEGLLVNQTPVFEETDVDETFEYADLELSTVPTETTVSTEAKPVIAECVSDNSDFTDLFDGIFDDELDAESASDDWALEVLLDKSQTNLETGNDADRANDLENAAKPEPVTAGDDEEADDSDQDYWF
ncbi:hypothetical protein [Methylomonas rapida]|uniref:Uncharacterized protein n=1 Tax=Methylomonas rapida TaxID=2963939 RepID=A0ABY7GP96_9GAMM|nr:hypothetical protein [Methylomonas rapida]WAR46316.1 hypothetical protein NM686_007305 [Methylomonas rapida]